MTSEAIERDLDNILTHDSTDVPSISESEFKRALLPALAHRGDDGNLTIWLQIAGSWRRPIDVVDDASGEVLFRCPALVGTTDLPNNHQAHESAYELVKNVQRKQAVVPRAAEEELVRNLSHRIKPTGSLVEAVKAWNTIYRRYGLDELVREVSVVGKSNEVPDEGTEAHQDQPFSDKYDEA